jgi:hypothetical protein
MALSRTKINKNREKSTWNLDRFVDDKRVTDTFVLFGGENHCFCYFGDGRACGMNGFQLNSRRLRSLKMTEMKFGELASIELDSITSAAGVF